MTGIVHACPPDGSDESPCCGQSPYAFPPEDQMTMHADLVTCHGRDERSWTTAPLSDHTEDSYGNCLVCRERVPETDSEWTTVAWPCPVLRIAAAEAERDETDAMYTKALHGRAEPEVALSQCRAANRNVLDLLHAAEAERDRLRAALEQIRDRYGAVCEEYTTCTHPACESSYGAWATADEATR